MTTKEKLIQSLINHGMFNSQALKVVDYAIPELKHLEDFHSITWDRPASEYPNVLHGILFSAIKPFALKWIEDNLPKAWFKPMFQ